MFIPSAHAVAATPAVQFNGDFLRTGNGQSVDISRFEKGDAVQPGDYLVDLSVNERWVGRFTIRFAIQPDRASAAPCLDAALLSRIGLNSAALPSSAIQALQSDGCIDLQRIIKDASIDFDLSALALSISIPQAFMQRKPRGYVSPELWDRGVPSATLAYDLNLFRSDTGGVHSTSVYAGLIGGVNLGDWHFRERASLSGTNGAWHFRSIETYVQRDLPSLQSSLRLGSAFTDGAVFDSYGFRGISLATDDRMRPDSRQGYAPVVRGIARTNARVRIIQNGNVLLETTVPPGPFEIDDLYPTGYGGDLLVTVLEADGAQQSFTVGYASVAQLLRRHVWRYSLAGGYLDVNGVRTQDGFFQGVIQHGIANALTVYAGMQAAPGYAAGLIGTALETPLGAVAIDATVARAHIEPVAVDDGYSVKLSYSKIVPGILTNISVAAYRHSSGGFWSMRDAMEARRLQSGSPVLRQRNRFQLNITQNLGKRWGSLYIVGMTTSYWNRASVIMQLQAGYNNVARLDRLNLNYGLAFSRQHDSATGRINSRVLVNMSLALGERLNSPRLAATLTDSRIDGESMTSGQLALSGTLGEDQEYAYNAEVRLDPHASSVGVNGSYRAPFATLSTGASKGTGYSQFSFGASGGLVVHPGGVTLANRLGDTIAVVEADNARGAVVSSGTGARIDGAGYAVVPYLMPYRENEISIDPRGTSTDVEMRTTSQQVAPHANAVVMLRYATVSGQGVMIAARLPDGSVVPFGASVSNGKHADAGLVGEGGVMFLRGIPETGRLLVAWGNAPDQRCSFAYRLPAKHGAGQIPRLDAVCRPDDTRTALSAGVADLPAPDAAASADPQPSIDPLAVI